MDPLNALGPCIEVMKCTCSPFARMINYFRNVDENMSLLRQKNQELIARETDIRRDLQRAEVQRKVARNRVTLLLEKVTKVKDRVDGIANSPQEHMGCFSSCLFRLKLAKRVVEMSEEMDILLGETDQFTDELVVDQTPPRAQLMPVRPLVGKTTVEKNLDAILEALRDPMIAKIGVYAMGGSGKTTTIMNINNQLETTEDFDKIIWVTVSKDLNLDKVQNDIARQLHLDLSTYDDQVQRASELCRRLKQVNKFLIIFDDMWDRIPLEKVGIPEPDKVNMCKIVLTTRSLTVCHGMETDKNIKLQLLSEEEAWELFLQKAVNIPTDVRLFAEQVVRQCGGLPLAINTVGRAMRRESRIRLWRKALMDLRSSPTEITGMEEEVFKALHFSYRRLKNDTVRKCFLYVALFPEDYKIETEKLVRYWMAESLINEQGNLETEMDEGFKIVKELVNACMFEEFEEGNIAYRTDFIRMHDSLRDLAIKIMEDEGGLMVKDGSYKAAKISGMNDDYQFLDDQLIDSPHLTTLVMSSTNAYSYISSLLFYQMPALQILDLSRTKIEKLPPSLSDLCNLRALLLQECSNLVEIPSLAKLRKLKALNLSLTAIKKLPEGMEALISLRSLDISCTRKMESCLIPELSNLEELHFDGCEVWRMDFLTTSNCINEIKCLMRLAVLTLSFADWNDYQYAIMCLQWEKFKNFYIEISNGVDWHNTDHSDKRLLPEAVNMSHQKINRHPSLSLLLPPNTKYAQISYSEIQRFSVLLGGLKFLSKCSIRNCSIMSGNSFMLGDEMEEYTFTSLEYLKLSAIDNCTILLEGMLPRACLTNLRVLKVHGCDCLKNLFLIDHIKNLKNIEVIKVTGCELLQELIRDSNGEGRVEATVNTTTSPIILPWLHTLIFERLPELHTISRMMWVCVSLCHVEVDECPNLKKLPFSVESLPKLEKIQGETQWWEALEWDDPDVKNLLQPHYTCT